MDAHRNQPKTAVEHFNIAATHYEKYTGGCTRELARALLELPQLVDVGAAGSIILDNACGTGIVAEEIIQQQRGVGRKETAVATIHVVDPAPNMVDIACQKLDHLSEGQFKIAGHVMPGEKLEFDDNTFTHSITNLGILFYSDGLAGAREIYRTLRTGSVAVVTSWTDLGYLEPIIKPAQLEIRPNEPPYQLPISPEWLSSSHLESVLVQGGFPKAEVSVVKVHYGAKTLEEVTDLLTHSFQAVWKDWCDAERTRFRALVREKVANIVEEYTMPNGETGVGIPMMASVALCRK